jgi:hypothetical protein
MTVASLELCKELLELSGWEDTYFWWDKDEQRVPEKQMVVQAGKIFADDTPAYDLGYLIRKLPEGIEIKHGGMTRGMWRVLFYGGKQQEFSLADIPEDALCQLAIILFKQNILTRKDDL